MGKSVALARAQPLTQLSQFWFGELTDGKISFRTVDPSIPAFVPFCRIVLASRKQDDPARIEAFHELHTDQWGRESLDKVDGPFSLAVVQRFGFIPERFAMWFQSKGSQKTYDAAQRPEMTLAFEPVPTGTGSLRGTVRNQHGKPLTEYYITLTHTRRPDVAAGDSFEYALRVPVTDEGGRFDIGKLAAGPYKLMVRHFDYPTHVWSFNGPTVEIPAEPNAVVETNLTLEAKELLYGTAVDEDGKPLSGGGWTATFSGDGRDPFGGRSFSLGFDSGGSFRVSLSKEERVQLIANSKGFVELHSHDRSRQAKVHIDKLSSNPERPAVVVLPRVDDG